MDFAQRIAIETGADFVCVTKRAVGFILAEQQRAEMGSRALRIRVAAYYESLDLRAFDLQPIAAAGSTIGRVAQFADDSLQSALGDRCIKILPALHDVIAVAHRPFAKDQFAQKILALFQRNSSRVETIEREQVKDVIADRNREAE